MASKSTDTILAELKEKGFSNINGFGKFTVKTQAARTGRNPATGETIQIPAKKVIKFSASKTLKDQFA